MASSWLSDVLNNRLTEPYSDEALLQKYDLKANDAILAEEKHMGLYEELLQNHDAKLIAGGAAQNTARGAQVYPSAFSSSAIVFFRSIWLRTSPRIILLKLTLLIT